MWQQQWCVMCSWLLSGWLDVGCGCELTCGYCGVLAVCAPCGCFAGCVFSAFPSSMGIVWPRASGPWLEGHGCCVVWTRGAGLLVWHGCWQVSLWLCGLGAQCPTSRTACPFIGCFTLSSVRVPCGCDCRLGAGCGVQMMSCVLFFLLRYPCYSGL